MCLCLCVCMWVCLCLCVCMWVCLCLCLVGCKEECWLQLYDHHVEFTYLNLTKLLLYLIQLYSTVLVGELARWLFLREVWGVLFFVLWYNKFDVECWYRLNCVDGIKSKFKYVMRFKKVVGFISKWGKMSWTIQNKEWGKFMRMEGVLTYPNLWHMTYTCSSLFKLWFANWTWIVMWTYWNLLKFYLNKV